jgi:hypothetical protein
MALLVVCHRLRASAICYLSSLSFSDPMLKVALVGTGFIGSVHAANVVHHPETNLAVRTSELQPDRNSYRPENSGIQSGLSAAPDCPVNRLLANASVAAKGNPEGMEGKEQTSGIRQAFQRDKLPSRVSPYPSVTNRRATICTRNGPTIRTLISRREWTARINVASARRSVAIAATESNPPGVAAR